MTIRNEAESRITSGSSTGEPPRAGVTRAAWLFLLAALLVLLHKASCFAGFADHASVLAGMPRSPWSWLLGPSFVVLQLVVVVVAPILAIAATLDTLLLLRRRA
jgi:hypothetical protein